jgi:hypothetical protein
MRLSSLSLILALGWFASCEAQESPNKKDEAATEEAKPKKEEGKSLFDGKTLKGWKKIPFGGSGDIEVEDGEILYMGEVLTGIKLDGEPSLKTNYEISLEAKRIDGVDFFCALTFPIADAHSTFIVGGWGGSLVGISSIDNMDASENSTGSVHKLDDKVWHKIRLRVTDTKLEAWIGDKQVVQMMHTGHEMGMRSGEIEECAPLGLATFQTKAAYRNIRIKQVDPNEK